MALEQDPRTGLEVKQKEENAFSDKDLRNLISMTNILGANIHKAGFMIALAILFHGCATFFS